MRKINEYFFGVDKISATDAIFFYGIIIMMLIIAGFSIYGMATI